MMITSSLLITLSILGIREVKADNDADEHAFVNPEYSYIYPVDKTDYYVYESRYPANTSLETVSFGRTR